MTGCEAQDELGLKIYSSYLPPLLPTDLSSMGVRHRPLPDLPRQEEEEPDRHHPGHRDHGLGDRARSFTHEPARWVSRENLLAEAEEEAAAAAAAAMQAESRCVGGGSGGGGQDPQLFVALYDFQAGGENQLSLKKGTFADFIRARVGGWVQEEKRLLT